MGLLLKIVARTLSASVINASGARRNVEGHESGAFSPAVLHEEKGHRQVQKNVYRNPYAISLCETSLMLWYCVCR
jgi:hypothetical protein